MTEGLPPSARRANEPDEILDRDDLSLDDRRRALRDLSRVNRLLFGRSALLRTLLPLLREAGSRRQTMLDLAAGAGDSTASLRRAAERRGVDLRVVCSDRKLSHLVIGRENCSIAAAVVAEAAASPFRSASFDWAVSSLFFHHLDAAGRVEVSRDMRRVARRAAVVVDLRRSLWAGWALRILGRFIGMGRIALSDGLVSLDRTSNLAEWRRFAAAERARIDARFPARVALVIPASNGSAQEGEAPPRGTRKVARRHIDRANPPT